MGAVETAKDLLNLAHEAKNIDLHRRAVELMAQVTALQQENSDLSKENAALKAKLHQRDQLKWRDGLRWKDDDTTPFCPHCFEANEKAIHLQPMRMNYGHPMAWKCFSCEKYIRVLTPDEAKANGIDPSQIHLPPRQGSFRIIG